MKRTRGPAYVARLEKMIRDIQSQINDCPASISADRRSSNSTLANPQSDFLETIKPPSKGAHLFNPITCCLYGTCSGLEVLRRMRLYIDNALGIPEQDSSAVLLANALDSPIPLQVLPGNSGLNVFSPSRGFILHRVNTAFKNTLSFWPFVDREFVEEAVESMFNTKGSAQSGANHDLVPLVYATVALGTGLTSSTPQNMLDSPADAERLIG